MTENTGSDQEQNEVASQDAELQNQNKNTRKKNTEAPEKKQTRTTDKKNTLEKKDGQFSDSPTKRLSQRTKKIATPTKPKKVTAKEKKEIETTLSGSIESLSPTDEIKSIPKKATSKTKSLKKNSSIEENPASIKEISLLPTEEPVKELPEESLIVLESTLKPSKTVAKVSSKKTPARQNKVKNNTRIVNKQPNTEVTIFDTEISFYPDFLTNENSSFSESENEPISLPENIVVEQKFLDQEDFFTKPESAVVNDVPQEQEKSEQQTDIVDSTDSDESKQIQETLNPEQQDIPVAEAVAISENDQNEPSTKNKRSRSRRNRKKNSQQQEPDILSEEIVFSEVENEQVQIESENVDQETKVASSQKQPRKKMFVSVQPDEQIEVVITEEGQVQEYYVEMLQQVKTKGNIYKAVIHNVDPNLQAAFVNYGTNKNGFLQIDEVHPEYYNLPHEQAKGRKYPPIQKVLKTGQELLVQVVKEPTGNKGAFLTTYISIPGRFLVLTPGREQIGVSRKVENEDERSRLREMLEGLKPGSGIGVIVRTVSMGTNKANLEKDLENLKVLWKDIRKKGTEEDSPCQIYQEMDLTTRALRDYLTDTISEVWIDDAKTAESISDISEILFPKKKYLVKVHKDEGSTLFERFNLQRQLDQIHSREVSLPSGGRLVFDPTEALTAIDINSGRSGGKQNFEDMAYRTNIEAAKMIPLQLRLRDIGGQVVADFIEMRDKNHWKEVEKTLRTAMKIDRARYDIGKIGPFGMMELVRQRLGSSAISVSMETCPYCKGSGARRNNEWQAQQALKDLQRKMRAAQSQQQTELVYELEVTLAIHLLNSKRSRLCELEQQTGIKLEIKPMV